MMLDTEILKSKTLSFKEVSYRYQYDALMGSSLADGEILSKSKRRFIAQTPSE